MNKTSHNLQKNIPKETKTFIVAKTTKNNPLISTGSKKELRLKGIKRNSTPFLVSMEKQQNV